MADNDLKNLIKQQLPELINQDPQIRDFIARAMSEYFAPKQETETRFDQMMRELREDRERRDREWQDYLKEQNQRWEEQNQRWEEQNQKWEEQNQKWEEQNQRWEEQNQKWYDILNRIDQMDTKIDQNFEEIKKLNHKYDSAIGALGSRWGLYSEASFRNALAGILSESFGVEVLNITDYDDEGEVFGRPDQVELDVIIQNGLLILCEIKSSMSKSDMYIFDRKVSFYEKRHQRQAQRKIVISPMIDDRAKPVAKSLGIETYSYARDVETD